MGRLIVVEGLDGAGKRTFADGIEKAFLDGGVKVRRFAFPRYGQSRAADLVRAALYRRAGRLSHSTDGMAVLYALDRAEACDEIRQALADNDVVLLDRYVASNAAYGAARLHQDAGGDFVEWVRQLEFDWFELPPPDLQVLLRVPGDVATARARQRSVEEADRSMDGFEADEELQLRVAAVYDQLAARNWLSSWRLVDGSGRTDYPTLAATLLGGPPA